MKKFVIGSMVLGLAVGVQAQVLNLAPVGTPDLGTVSPVSLDVGVSLGDDSSLYGGRVNFLATENVLVFGEAGFVDIDDTDADGIAFGGGAQIEIPTDLDISTGVRVSYDFGELDGDGGDADFWNLTVLALVGGETGVEGLTWNGRAGISHLDRDATDDTELQIGGGVSFGLTEMLSAFAGVDFVDDLFVSLGARILFN